MPLKVASGLVNSSLKLTEVSSNILGTNIKNQRYSLNTNNSYGTITLGSSDAVPVDKTLTIHQSNEFGYIGDNYNYVTANVINQSLSASQIKIGGGIRLAHKSSADATFIDKIIIGDNMLTIVSSGLTNNFNHEANNISKGSKVIGSINQVVYKDEFHSEASIIDSASYNQSNKVTSFSKLYYKGLGYSTQSSYTDFVFSSTVDVINGVETKRFGNSETLKLSKGGIRIDGDSSDYSLLVSNKKWW